MWKYFTVIPCKIIWRKRCKKRKPADRVCMFFVLMMALAIIGSSLLSNFTKWPLYRLSSIIIFPDTERASSTLNCSPTNIWTHVEDILCKRKYTFLKNFKNPCWLEKFKKTPRLRCFPYFHIFGVCKSGTTDLFNRLIKHPQIIANKGILSKEVNFWTWRRYGKTEFHCKDVFNTTYPNKLAVPLNTYISYFDASMISSKKIVSNRNGEVYSNIITGHGDPMDFWDQTQWKWIEQNDLKADEPAYTAPHLIKHLNPNIKLILLLREPTERLYSHYYHGNFGKTSTTFHNHILQSIDILHQCQKRHSLRSCLYNQTIMNIIPTPIYASLYYVHIKEWLKVFPREQIYILRTEDYAKNIQHHIRQIFSFLDVDDVSLDQLNFICSGQHEFKTLGKQLAGPMRNDTRQLLLKYFRKPNEELAYILKDDKYLWNDI